jgi:hypothetical protein
MTVGKAPSTAFNWNKFFAIASRTESFTEAYPTEVIKIVSSSRIFAGIITLNIPAESEMLPISFPNTPTDAKEIGSMVDSSRIRPRNVFWAFTQLSAAKKNKSTNTDLVKPTILMLLLHLIGYRFFEAVYVISYLKKRSENKAA